MTTQNTSTPWEFVRAVEKYFGIKFKYDLAASKSNAKAPKFITEKDDSFKIKWPKSQSWLNPTFEILTKWINKCVREKQRGCKFKTIWPLSGDLNQIETWKNADIYIIFGRIWPNVRTCMLCDWGPSTGGKIIGLRWNKKDLTRIF